MQNKKFKRKEYHINNLPWPEEPRSAKLLESISIIEKAKMSITIVVCITTLPI
jgi:hypothetical protein